MSYCFPCIPSPTKGGRLSIGVYGVTNIVEKQSNRGRQRSMVNAFLSH